MTLRMPLIAFFASLLLLLAPLVSSAQTTAPAEVRATIMAQLLEDPRTADVPPDQLQQLVDALAAQAEVQGVDTADLTWQPRPTFAEPAAEPAVPGGACDGGFSALCVLTEAFGFVGDNPTVPLYLLVTSGLLVLLIVRMKRHHHAMGHFDAPVASASAASAPAAQPQQGMYV